VHSFFIRGVAATMSALGDGRSFSERSKWAEDERVERTAHIEEQKVSL
jgi:hypothetical protein